MSETPGPEFKVCLECRHVQPDGEDSVCLHPTSLEKPQRSRVTGVTSEPKQISCKRARLTEMLGFERRCGAPGRFWEARS